MAAGGLDPIGRAMRAHPAVEDDCGLDAMRRIAQYGDEDAKRALIKMGAVGLAGTAMGNHPRNGELQDHGCDLLEQLTGLFADVDQADLEAVSGAVKAAMARYPNYDWVKQYGPGVLKAADEAAYLTWL